MRSRQAPTVADFFCGAGGLSLGLQRAGFDVVLSADNDPIAMETHAHNVGGLHWTGDLGSPEVLLEAAATWGVEKVDVVAGGVPCQPFSRAGEARLKELASSGHRDEIDPRAGLWKSFLVYVEALQPRAVLVENVPDLPRWNDGAVLSGLMEGLGRIGYDVDVKILRALDFGVPQHRARLFIVGLSETGAFTWPQAVEERPTLWDGIGDLPPVPGGQLLERLPYRPPAEPSSFQLLMRKGLRKDSRWFIEDHITRDVRDDDFEAYELLGEGGTYKDLPARLQRYRTDIFTDKYKRLSREEASRSITAHIAKDGYWYIHPTQHRTLSIREAARIQSFPDDFRFAGQPTHRFRQIGNAVPPLLAEAIGGSLLDAIVGAPVELPFSREQKDIRGELLRWRKARKAHPWRSGNSPAWKVLVAEMCLGRLGVERASEAVRGLWEAAPDPAAVTASPAETADALADLGLTARTPQILGAARTIVERFGGDVPLDAMRLREVDGVGDSVAVAVLAFAGGRKVAQLDRPAARVVSRLNGERPQGRWQLRPDLYRLAGPEGPDARFNEALAELGRSVCTPTDSNCPACPLQTVCTFATKRGASTQLDLEAAA